MPVFNTGRVGAHYRTGTVGIAVEDLDLTHKVIHGVTTVRRNVNVPPDGNVSLLPSSPGDRETSVETEERAL